MHWLSIGLAIALVICRPRGARAAAPAAPPDLSRRRGTGDRDGEDARGAARRARARVVGRRQPRRGGGAAQPVPRPDRHHDRPRRRDRLHPRGRRRPAGCRCGGGRAGSGRRQRRAPARFDRAGPRGGRGGRNPDLHRRPEPREARAIELSYLYGEEQAAGAVHEALGVPLLGRNGKIGWLGVFSRDPEVRFGDDDVRRLEELAERVAPAIENARRFRKARQLADLDSLTGLHNRRYFYETLAREVDRAQRYQRRLSLVLVDVDGFKEINDRIGHLAGDTVLAEIADRIRQVVRSADIPCRVGGDEFAVIVPEVEGRPGAPARRADPARGLGAADRPRRPGARFGRGGRHPAERQPRPACSSAGTSRSTRRSTPARAGSPPRTSSWRKARAALGPASLATGRPRLSAGERARPHRSRSSAKRRPSRPRPGRTRARRGPARPRPSCTAARPRSRRCRRRRSRTPPP